MKDSEIIDALNCCYGFHCEKCPLKGDDHCGLTLEDESIKLIERLKAEIDKLKEEHDKNFEKWEILDKRTKERYAELYEEAKGVVRAKAIKEFAERLKKEAMTKWDWNDYVEVEEIDNLVKEMVGADNGRTP